MKLFFGEVEVNFIPFLELNFFMVVWELEQIPAVNQRIPNTPWTVISPSQVLDLAKAALLFCFVFFFTFSHRTTFFSVDTSLCSLSQMPHSGQFSLDFEKHPGPEITLLYCGHSHWYAEWVGRAPPLIHLESCIQTQEFLHGSFSLCCIRL